MQVRTPSLKRIRQVVRSGVFLSGLMMVSFASLGYMLFGEGVEADILLMFGRTPLAAVARLVLCLAIAVTYPLEIHVARDAVCQWLLATGRVSLPLSLPWHLALTWSLVLFSYVAGVFFNLDVVLELTGSVSILLAYTMPSLFFVLLMPGEWRVQKRKWAPLALVVLSGVGAVVQLSASIIKVVRILLE